MELDRSDTVHSTERGERARIGVVLAGGRATRLRGDKAGATLAGRPLLAHATAVVRAAGLSPRICARETTWLPGVDVETWREPAHLVTAVASALESVPDQPAHPLSGLAHALRRAAEPIVALPVDLPFLPPAVLRGLAYRTEPLALLALDGRPASLVLRADPRLAPQLEQAAAAGAPAMRTLVELGAKLVELSDLESTAPPHSLFNVSTSADLAEAHRLLAH